MHVLLFNEYYPPDTSATAKIAARMAETLARKHRVTVVAGRPSYDPDEHYPFALLRRDIRDGVTVERVGSTDYPRHVMRRRVLNYLSYLALAVPRAMALKPDVILSMTDPPIAGIAAAFVARRIRRPLVYNIQDMYPDMAVGGDIVSRGKLVNQWERMHCRALRQAARVIVLGEDMRERTVAKGVAEARVVVNRNWAIAPMEVPDRAHPIVQEIRGDSPFVALHAGNLGFYGSWQTLLKSAQLLQNGNGGSRPPTLLFVGDGANKSSLQAAAANATNVRFLPFRPASEIPFVMMAGDVHIITIRRGLEGVVVPSKLYSILAGGRPILVVASKESDAARIVLKWQCGVVADPDNPAEVAAAIHELRCAPERLAAMGLRAREAAESYARLGELEKLVSIVEEAAFVEQGGSR